jgi:hypothetical protein
MVGTAAVAWAGVEAWQLAGSRATAADNRYAYVQGRDDLRAIERRLALLAAVDEDGLTIAVIAPAAATWPLPWHLRAHRAGYWSSLAEVPTGLAFDVVIVVDGDPAEHRFAEPTRTVYFGLHNDHLGLMTFPARAWQAAVAAQP